MKYTKLSVLWNENNLKKVSKLPKLVTVNCLIDWTITVSSEPVDNYSQQLKIKSNNWISQINIYLFSWGNKFWMRGLGKILTLTYLHIWEKFLNFSDIWPAQEGLFNL